MQHPFVAGVVRRLDASGGKSALLEELVERHMAAINEHRSEQTEYEDGDEGGGTYDSRAWARRGGGGVLRPVG